VGFFLADHIILDASERVDRRRYVESSTRASSWESRFDVGVDWANPGLVSWRLFHESEIIRYDQPDDLDFDFTRLRFGAGPLFRPTLDLGLWAGPVLGTLLSSNAPAEEYVELAWEIGVDWRIGPFWISVTDEFGFRDYKIEATGTPADLSTGASDTGTPQVAIYSDSSYNRLTAFANADISGRVSLRFFGNWEPENHQADVDDADSRIVSGGIQVRF
jgi:hypothetical protein